MKRTLGITGGIAAASLLSSVATAQIATTPPRARSAQVYVAQKGGGYLGIGGVEVTSERVKALNLKEERGVEVSKVDEDGPAAKAGIKEGDVLLDFNGTPVQGTNQFQRIIAETPPGRQVKVTVWRNGAPQTLTATVGERKGTVIANDDGSWNFNMPPVPPMPPMPNFEIPRFNTIYRSPMLGIEGESLESQEQLAEFFG